MEEGGCKTRSVSQHQLDEAVDRDQVYVECGCVGGVWLWWGGGELGGRSTTRPVGVQVEAKLPIETLAANYTSV